MATFRERLKLAAAHAKVEYGQTAIAKSLGLNKQTVDRWFGEGEPKPAQLFLIEQKWGISARWLALEEGPMVLEPSGNVRKIPTTDTRMVDIPPILYAKLFGAIRTFLNNDKEGQEEILNAVLAIGDGKHRARKKRS